MKEDKTIDHGNGLVEYIQYYHDGKLQSHYSKLNGKVYGEFRVYLNNGDLYYHDYFKNGEVEGEQIIYKYEK